MSEYLEIKAGQTSRAHQQEVGAGGKTEQTALGFPAVEVQFKSERKIFEGPPTSADQT